MLEKEKVRDLIFKIRENNNINYFNELNKKFFNNFLKISFLNKFKNEIIAGYYSFEKECNICKILNCYIKNNTICLPITLKKDQEMIFREWNCLKNSLKKNEIFKRFEVFEPFSECRELIPNIVLVPAVAIDIYGNRIGYGAGYYDKTLKNFNSINIATVFDFQVFEKEFENSKHDVKMDFILTESRFIKVK